ncbi:MAG TPA: HD domain-containing protein, partial [bacterium]|nr:HD domain-containing protein [bacterium]
VSELACRIARKMGIAEDIIERIRIAGLLHDIGKVSVPGEILNKPSKLNSLEFEIVKIHSRAGYDIVKKIDLFSDMAEIILQHHERLDGSGYPRGLKNGEILLEARILAVADVVEAMSSHRPYRPALPEEEIKSELMSNKGKLYDPEVVDAYLATVPLR